MSLPSCIFLIAVTSIYLLKGLQMDYLSRIVASSDNREAWLDARNTGITASNAANMSSLASLDSVIKSKFYDGFMGNKATEWGLEREPYLLDYSNFEQNLNLFHSVENKRFMATPDGIRESSDKDFPLELCQVKTTSKRYKKIPAAHYRQVQWEMFVMGASRCMYVWEEHENYVPIELEPKWEWIDRDTVAIEKLKSLATVLLKRLDEANAFEREMA